MNDKNSASPGGQGPNNPRGSVPVNNLQNSDAVRDGRAPKTALLSYGICSNPEEEFKYLAHHLGWLPVPELPQASAFNRELQEIDAIHRQIEEAEDTTKNGKPSKVEDGDNESKSARGPEEGEGDPDCSTGNSGSSLAA
ncbi:uncharacterized protein EI97DRAFT_455012 [Westerdykella ornata]|uniref:Uncharacterized protein n=1 Tax=Westerdykella ornata TaxID=318751 RepID=A0A6A6JWG9_WESOR|nr:uncharacterized protein EI97DRAFT_455012 [Westerdykella ornata]KAF2280086.1 hypothetical protein EI97DRAFT_455012 [Westerdykella ornata]